MFSLMLTDQSFSAPLPLRLGVKTEVNALNGSYFPRVNVELRRTPSHGTPETAEQQRRWSAIVNSCLVIHLTTIMAAVANRAKTNAVPQPRLDTFILYLYVCKPLDQCVLLHLSAHTTISDMREGVALALGADVRSIRLTTRGGREPSKYSTLQDIFGAHAFAELELRVRLLGGKGGFGNMLRAQGGRMSKRSKDDNMDSCRDLEGRRLGAIREAKALADYIAKEPERKAALDEAQKRKFAKLEKMLGREPKTISDFEEAAEKLEDVGESLEGSPEAESPAASSSAGPSSFVHTPPKRKERLDDHEFVEQSREIVDNVRSAVAAAMKKRKGKKRAVPAADAVSNSA